MSDYLFTSLRLGFRNWHATDYLPFAAMNADPRVMEHFPTILTRQASDALADRLREHYEREGFTYYAVDRLDTDDFIGFIGLARQDYPAPFTPAVDIGWRLTPAAWGRGLATEGARRCLAYAFNALGLDRVVAVCTPGNRPSERVMQKAAMEHQGTFEHPGLTAWPELARCSWYERRAATSP